MFEKQNRALFPITGMLVHFYCFFVASDLILTIISLVVFMLIVAEQKRLTPITTLELENLQKGLYTDGKPILGFKSKETNG